MTKKSKKTVEQPIAIRLADLAKRRAELAEQPFAKCRAEIAKRMHVAELCGGFHILEIPAIDGGPFECWPGPFKTKRAAELFLEDLLDAYADGEPLRACGGYISRIKGYEQQAELLQFLERRDGLLNLRELARDLSELLLCRYGSPIEHDTEIPF